jgi:hypothetical protein
MWGLNWGQMIWGQAAAVPAVSFWGLIVVGAVLGAWGVKRLRGPRPRLLGTIALGLVLLLPISARALPFTFTNGTVADATQVNANFAALAAGQGLAPSATANLVDLQQSGACPVAPGVGLNIAVGSDGLGRPFSIQAGQTLVVTSLSVTFRLGASSANQGIAVAFLRLLPSGGSQIEGTNITLDGGGAGSATINLGNGSPFGPGTNLCIQAQNISTGVNVSSFFAAAHGFLTTQ